MEFIVIAALIAGGIYLLFKVFSPAKEIDNAIKAIQEETKQPEERKLKKS